MQQKVKLPTDSKSINTYVVEHAYCLLVKVNKNMSKPKVSAADLQTSKIIEADKIKIRNFPSAKSQMLCLV